MEGPEGEGWPSITTAVTRERPTVDGPGDARRSDEWDRPGLIRRIGWWVLGPAFTGLLTWSSIADVIAPPGVRTDGAPADLLALVLVVVLALTTLFRRRWPLWTTAVASVAAVAFGARQYPPAALFVLAPALCAAAAVYRGRLRPHLAVASSASEGGSIDEQIAVAWLGGDTGVGDTGDRGATVEILDGAGEHRWSDAFGEDGRVILLSAPVGLPDGGFAIAGGVNDALDGEPHLGEADAFVRAYRADGAVRWTRQFGTEAGEIASALAVGPDGTLVVTGASHGQIEPGGIGAFVTTFDPDGGRGWTRQFGTERDDVAVSAAIDGDGGAVVVTGIADQGQSRVTAFAADGRQRWMFEAEEADGVVADVAVVEGRVLVVGCRNPSFLNLRGRDTRAVVIEVADGRAVWERELGSPGGACATDSAPGPGASLLVGGVRRPPGPPQAFLVEVDLG